MLAKIRNDSFDKYTNSLSIKNNFLWVATKNILKKRKNFPPLKKENLSWAITDYDKALLLGTHLAKVFQPLTDIPFSPTLNNIEALLSTPLPMHAPPKYFSPGEVDKCI